MSHGNSEKNEPNFTPLLDLVLQLVMFFMLCANFVMEQTDIQIKLPKAHSAVPLSERVNETIYLNVNEKGQVQLPPAEREGEHATLDNATQVEGYMKRRAEIEKRKSGKDKPEATLILRIDERTEFKDTYPLMQACRKAGYSNVQMRALLATAKD